MLDRRGPLRGFSLVELVVAIALLALLLGLAAPSFATWTRNAQVRSVGDALQSGLRQAQAEAVRRNRQVVFFLTTSKACTTAAESAANGAYWQIRTVPLMAGEAAEPLQCGVLNDVAEGVGITGPRAVCLNSSGRQVANAAPGVTGATCTLSATGTSIYDLAVTGADRALRVTLTLGGQVRLCDPSRARSTTHPDGCT